MKVTERKRNRQVFTKKKGGNSKLGNFEEDKRQIKNIFHYYSFLKEHRK